MERHKRCNQEYLLSRYGLDPTSGIGIRNDLLYGKLEEDGGPFMLDARVLEHHTAPDSPGLV